MGPLPAAAGCDCHVCRPEGPYDAMDRRLIDTVLQHGWQVTLVSDEVACSDPGHDHAGDSSHHGEDHETVAFAYTVGLGHRAGHPELLMSGLDPQLMHHALNDVAQRVMAGRRYAAGDVLEGVLGGVPVVLERLADAALADTVTWAGWFHRARPEALVVVWPSTSGVFAWQPGAPDALDELQPPAWREQLRHTGGVSVDPDWVFAEPPEHPVMSCTHVVRRGDPVLSAARESDTWTVHCGTPGHVPAELLTVHLAHVVRAAPSLRQLADLAPGEQAVRTDPDASWQRSPPQR